jgi:hypothetical protein
MTWQFPFGDLIAGESAGSLLSGDEDDLKNVPRLDKSAIGLLYHTIRRVPIERCACRAQFARARRGER